MLRSRVSVGCGKEERVLQEGRTVHSAVRIGDIFENWLKVGAASTQDA